MKASRKVLTGDRNQCSGCGEYFNSLKGFDRHRTGEFGQTRRCRTVDELTTKGWCRNKDGFWITESRLRDYRAKPTPEGKTGAIHNPATTNVVSPNQSPKTANTPPLITNPSVKHG